MTHAVEGAVHTVEHTVQHVATQAVHTIEDATKHVEQTVQSAASDVAHASQSTAKQVEHTVQGAATQAVHSAESTVKQVEHNVERTATQVVHTAEAAAKQVGQSVQRTATEVVHNAENTANAQFGISVMANDIKQVASSHTSLGGKISAGMDLAFSAAADVTKVATGSPVPEQQQKHALQGALAALNVTNFIDGYLAAPSNPKSTGLQDLGSAIKAGANNYVAGIEGKPTVNGVQALQALGVHGTAAVVGGMTMDFGMGFLVPGGEVSDVAKVEEVASEAQKIAEVGSTLQDVNKLNGAADSAATTGAVAQGVRNGHLAGSVHPVTGVPFDSNGFPIFGSKYDAQLPPNLYNASDRVQFRESTSQLRAAIQNQPELGQQFTPAQLEDIANGQTPKSYTWHHSQNEGVMQLVNSDVHAATGHSGGRSIWGGGAESR